MTVPSPEEVQAELRGAFETLALADKILREDGPRPEVVALLYYAIFHAARAAIWSRGTTAKTHRGLEARFHQEFIEPGILESHFLTILRYGREQREVADYDRIRFELSEDKIGSLAADAHRFLTRIQQLLQDQTTGKAA